MTKIIARRALIEMLAALAAVSATGVGANVPDVTAAGIDADGAADIGRAWRALHPGDGARLRSGLFPNGIDAAALPRLAERIRDDFRRDAIFVHKGWFLSVTEAQLCSLLGTA